MLYYLATPYSKYPHGIERAFQDAAKTVAALLRKSIISYSPIAHTHPVAIFGGIDPLDHRIWLDFDAKMMTACDAMIVAQMDGWRESIGIAYEIEAFVRMDKPIYDLDMTTFELAPRPRK